MATLTGQSIASSYEQLLHVDADGGGNSTTHVSVKDGDNGTTFALTLATDAVMITSTNRLEFGDDGTYIHQSADGVLDLVSDTEIEINATDVDMNGALDLDGTFTQDAGAVVFNEAGADYDFRVEGVGEANALFVQGSDGFVGIGTNAPSEELHVQKDQSSGTIAMVKNDTSAADAYACFQAKYGSQYLQVKQTSAGMSTDGMVVANAGIIQSYGNTAGINIFTYDNYDVTLGTGKTARMNIDSSGDVTVETGDLIMGTSGKGISFAATADAGGMTAEILDDYEEGTWTAAVTDASSNAMTMNGSYVTGYYTKVGNLVTVTGYFITTSLGSASGNIRITGLPFTIANNYAAYTGGTCTYGVGLAITAGHSVTFYGAINDTYINLQVWDATTGTTDMQASEWTDDGRIMVNLTYRAA